MGDSHKGACLCGGVSYEIGKVEAMGSCHCTRCQRWTGTGGATVYVVPASSFTLTGGKDLARTYQEKGFGDRIFCSRCGSSLYASGGDKNYVLAGTVKGDLGMRPQFHIQVAYKAPWDEIVPGPPQFPEWPPHM